MKRLLIALVAILLLSAVPASAQTYLSSTTLSSAVSSESQGYFLLASTANVSVGDFLYVDNELARVTKIPVSGRVELIRETLPQQHLSGATVVIVKPAATIGYDPVGKCTAASYRYLPLINVNNGNVWLCRPTVIGGSNVTVWMGTNPRILTFNSLLLSLQ